MIYETLLLQRHEAVLKITVHRPEVLNAQSRIMREEFDHDQQAAPAPLMIRPSRVVRARQQRFRRGRPCG